MQNKRYNLSQTKKSNFTAKMFGVQSYKTILTGAAYKFWSCTMYQRTPPAVYNGNILII